jgi:hypothetical protein
MMNRNMTVVKTVLDFAGRTAAVTQMRSDADEVRLRTIISLGIDDVIVVDDRVKRQIESVRSDETNT